jgi:hypothetical protein
LAGSFSAEAGYRGRERKLFLAGAKKGRRRRGAAGFRPSPPTALLPVVALAGALAVVEAQLAAVAVELATVLLEIAAVAAQVVEILT